MTEIQPTGKIGAQNFEIKDIPVKEVNGKYVAYLNLLIPKEVNIVTSGDVVVINASGNTPEDARRELILSLVDYLQDKLTSK